MYNFSFLNFKRKKKKKKVLILIKVVIMQRLFDLYSNKFLADVNDFIYRKNMNKKRSII